MDNLWVLWIAWRVFFLGCFFFVHHALMYVFSRRVGPYRDVESRTHTRRLHWRFRSLVQEKWMLPYFVVICWCWFKINKLTFMCAPLYWTGVGIQFAQPYKEMNLPTILPFHCTTNVLIRYFHGLFVFISYLTNRDECECLLYYYVTHLCEITAGLLQRAGAMMVWQWFGGQN